MGREMTSLRITATLSSHNSEQDDITEALWEDLRARVDEITRDPKYASIGPMVF